MNRNWKRDWSTRMIKKEFRFEFDTDGYKYNAKKKKGKGISKTGSYRQLTIEDLMDNRKHIHDLELTLVTPDRQEHKKYISRDSLSRMQTFRLRMIEEDEVTFLVNES